MHSIFADMGIILYDNSLRNFNVYQKQEAQLSQRDRSTHYVSLYHVNCCTAVRNI